jgi:methyl-accepting chemotaxis protein
VEDVSKGSEAQSYQIEEISASVVESNEGIQSVNESAKAMAATAQLGNTAVAETIAAMSRVRDEVDRTTESVKQLDHHGQSIGKIVETIQQIAEQINLLALNAAIEAARAGEHGRGFAVVADEVRKLAEKSGSSTRQIAELIDAVRETVAATVKGIDRTQVEVSEGSKKSQSAGESLNAILAATEEVLVRNETVARVSESISESVTHIAQAAAKNRDAATEMMAGSSMVLESIESVASVSEECAAGAQQLTASVEEVGHAATELAKMSQDLQSIVASFKIESGDTGSSKSKNSLRIAA